MKRTAVLLLFLCVALFLTALPLSPAPQVSAAGSTYALITGEKTLFLREPIEPSISNTFFILPKTYFVNVIQANYTENLHKIRYRDLEGYVKKSDVSLKDYTPASVYPPEVTLKVNIDADSVNLRARPDHYASDVVYKIPSTSAKIEYYNDTDGTAGISDEITTWYYVRINLGSDSVVRGYLHAAYVLLESTIPPENDISPAITPDVRPDGSDGTGSENEDGKKNDPVRLVGIIALCIPAVAIVVIIFARPKKKKGERAEKFSS